MRGVLEIFFDWYMIGVMFDGTDMPTLLLLGVCLETVWLALNGSFTHFNATLKHLEMLDRCYLAALGGLYAKKH